MFPISARRVAAPPSSISDGTTQNLPEHFSAVAASSGKVESEFALLETPTVYCRRSGGKASSGCGPLDRLVYQADGCISASAR